MRSRSTEKMSSSHKILNNNFRPLLLSFPPLVVNQEEWKFSDSQSTWLTEAARREQAMSGTMSAKPEGGHAIFTDLASYVFEKVSLASKTKTSPSPDKKSSPATNKKSSPGLNRKPFLTLKKTVTKAGEKKSRARSGQPKLTPAALPSPASSALQSPGLTSLRRSEAGRSANSKQTTACSMQTKKPNQIMQTPKPKQIPLENAKRDDSMIPPALRKSLSGKLGTTCTGFVEALSGALPSIGKSILAAFTDEQKQHLKQTGWLKDPFGNRRINMFDEDSGNDSRQPHMNGYTSIDPKSGPEQVSTVIHECADLTVLFLVDQKVIYRGIPWLHNKDSNQQFEQGSSPHRIDDKSRLSSNDLAYASQCIDEMLFDQLKKDEEKKRIQEVHQLLEIDPAGVNQGFLSIPAPGAGSNPPTTHRPRYSYHNLLTTPNPLPAHNASGLSTDPRYGASFNEVLDFQFERYPHFIQISLEELSSMLSDITIELWQWHENSRNTNVALQTGYKYYFDLSSFIPSSSNDSAGDCMLKRPTPMLLEEMPTQLDEKPSELKGLSADTNQPSSLVSFAKAGVAQYQELKRVTAPDNYIQVGNVLLSDSASAIHTDSILRKRSLNRSSYSKYSDVGKSGNNSSGSNGVVGDSCAVSIGESGRPDMAARLKFTFAFPDQHLLKKIILHPTIKRADGNVAKTRSQVVYLLSAKASSKQYVRDFSTHKANYQQRTKEGVQG